MDKPFLIIDNYDSFTWNLVQLIYRATNVRPIVLKNDDPWPDSCLDNFSAILLSPGPGSPLNQEDFGICSNALNQDKLPILGVCLGFQGIAAKYGARIDKAPEQFHGRVSVIKTKCNIMFESIPELLEVTRYHSLLPYDLPVDLIVTAHIDGLPMAFRHKSKPIWGVQFHPESICSQYGEQLILNFVKHCVTNNSNQNAHSTSPDLSVKIEKLSYSNFKYDLVRKLTSNEEYYVFLDSCSEHTTGRYSAVCLSSSELETFLEYSVARKTVTVHCGSSKEEIKVGNFFEYFESRVKQFTSRLEKSDDELPELIPLGYVGYFGYELQTDSIREARFKSPHNDVGLIFCDRAVVFDHKEHFAYILTLYSSKDDRLGAQAAKWRRETRAILCNSEHAPEPKPEPKPVSQPVKLSKLSQRHSEDEYLSLIEKCKEKIECGESYEICLTNQFSMPSVGEGHDFYEVFRKVSPAPFASHVKFKKLSIYCGSMERFIRVDSKGTVESCPIKGTRPRLLKNSTLDKAQTQELKNSVKDRSENLMIVDLMRNDLLHSCELDSVTVPQLFEIKSFSHVHQMISTVTGSMRDDSSTVDLLKNTFPGGSMTGAPKKRTLEIIDELEQGPRGIYSGSIGVVSFFGTMDLNIVIRTIVSDGKTYTMGAGGAIVALSDAQSEYEETIIKVSNTIQAIRAYGEKFQTVEGPK
ncbi:aminodeoxychorismate synthase component I [Marinobacter halodurans]|uniref:aminodeoxychorismate synthase n=1 Tax=Marinobacter halodurans TaxID=2528979 RepID=A0ABY1ZDM3_9GAMM|nr:chorismate-binding protein [Marinobacter halodurans]TBW47410.1 aminodeoxychorismate synthase component I [Marinobacter halodurans]